MIWLRSAIFYAGLWIFTPVYFVFALTSLPFGPMTRYRMIAPWSKIVLKWLGVTCGLRYRVLGAENLPRSPAIVLSKHQSAWETLAFQSIFPPLVWVLKRELLRIPFLGWALAMVSPIAIDRSARRGALKQLLDQGKDRLSKGFWIVIFPEGTRVKPGQKGKYNLGGAWLATHTGNPVVPVAHNAGEFWGKDAFLKRPGTITVIIGEPIDPSGIEAEKLNRQVEEWIEGRTREITGERYGKEGGQ
jgi:1-acyl-sn-glycerol-3-phosphate acyltransferase